MCWGLLKTRTRTISTTKATSNIVVEFRIKRGICPVPGTNPRTTQDSIQRSVRIQTSGLEVLSLLRREMSRRIRVLGRLLGEETLEWPIHQGQAGKPGGHENVQKRHHSNVVIRAVLFTSPVSLQPLEGRRQILGIKYSLPLPAWLQ